MAGGWNKKQILAMSTLVAIISSFLILCASMLTNHWIESVEDLGEDKTGANCTETKPCHYWKRMYAGLWWKCIQNDKYGDAYICHEVTFFQEVDKDSPDTAITGLVLHAVQKSVFFVPASGILILGAGLLCFISLCDSSRKFLTFISGITFIIAGLSTLIGIVLFVGGVTEEAVKPKTVLDDPPFVYRYEYSFILAVISFVLTETAGVLAIYLYIYRHKYALRKQQERLKISVSEMNDIREHPHSKAPRRHSFCVNYSGNSPGESPSYGADRGDGRAHTSAGTRGASPSDSASRIYAGTAGRGAVVGGGGGGVGSRSGQLDRRQPPHLSNYYTFSYGQTAQDYESRLVQNNLTGGRGFGGGGGGMHQDSGLLAQTANNSTGYYRYDQPGLHGTTGRATSAIAPVGSNSQSVKTVVGVSGLGATSNAYPKSWNQQQYRRTTPV